MIFNTIPSIGFFAPYIDCYWVLECTPKEVPETEYVFPDGNTQLVFHYGDVLKQQHIARDSYDFHHRSFLHGQNKYTNKISHTGSTKMFVVVFKPYGAKAFFNFPMNEISTQNISLADISKQEAFDTEDKIFHATNVYERINIINLYLMDRFFIKNQQTYNLLLQSIDTLKNLKLNPSVEELAKYNCLSIRQFERIFAEHIGVSPKMFLRINRINNVIDSKKRHPTASLTELAHQYNFHDQSHFNKDFKSLIGLNPRVFFKLYQNSLEPVSL